MAASAKKQARRSGVESVRAELALRRFAAFRTEALEAFAAYTAGDPFAQAVVVTGTAAEGEGLLDGRVAVALAKALVAMGYRKNALFAIALGEGLPDAAELEHRRMTLRPLVELVDPVSVIAADAVAANAVRAAFGLPVDTWGHVRKLGRSIVLFDDFAAALDDEQLKREAWRQLKMLSS